MSARVHQTLGYDDSVFIQEGAGTEFRRAVVYRVRHIPDSKPAVWRIRVEKFPEHVNAGLHGWFGGRVLWDHDQAVRENAETIALAWVADGIL
jgi:hypothetical protein